jgi:hypothetical protein
MRLYENGTFLVNRDEQRVIKKAAYVERDLEISRVLAHYLGVRKSSSHALGEVKLKIRQEELDKSLYLQEANELPELIVRLEDSPSVFHMRYVYGPELALRSMELVAGAVNKNVYTTEFDIRTAQNLAALAMPPLEIISTRH